MALHALSFCAGIGGIDLGLAEWCRSVGFVERDAFAAAVLVARMEDAQLDPAPVFDDLRSFDGRAWRGCVDLITAGYPCQPFSVAEKQLGERDERHLWPRIAEIIDEVAPPLVFCENVAGHLRLGFDRVLADLAALGFDAEWGLVRASDVGAPHRRERLFVLAYRGERGREAVRRCGVLDGERQAQRHDADGCGEDVADASSREARRARLGREAPDDSEPLAHAERGRAQREREPGDLAGASGSPQGEGDQRERSGQAARDRGAAVEHAAGSRRAQAGDRSPLLAAGQPLAADERVGHSERTRPEERRRRAVARAFPAAWPPGPSDRAGWERWIGEGGPQPVVRRSLDELPAFMDRSDRLRCLGNAVVPAQARAAFRELARMAVSA